MLYGTFMCDTPQLMCESCGETETALRLNDAGLCDDCAEPVFQEALEPVLGYRPCCTVVWKGEDLPALCLVPAGMEHDHG